MEFPPLEHLAAAALVLAFVAGLLNRWRLRYKYDLHRIPGPPAYPIVGNIPQILQWKNPQFHLILHEWAKKYGQIVKVEIPGAQSGCSSQLYVTDPEFIQNNITRHGTDGMPRSAYFTAVRKLCTPAKHGFIGTELEESALWKAWRKTMSRAFSTAALKVAFLPMAKKADELVDLIKSCPPKNPIDFQQLLLRFAFDAVGVGGFGIDFKSLQNERHPYLIASQYCCDDTVASFLNPFRSLVKWVFPMCKLAQDCNRMYSEMYSFYDMIAKELRGRGDPTEDDVSMAACMLRVKNTETGLPLNDAGLSAEVGGFLMAATDTSSHEIMWALFAIACHPDVEVKIVDELKASGLFLRIREEGANQVSYSDIMGLEYLGMAVKEAIRLFPVAPFNFRVTPEDGMSVRGYRVPKGTVVCVNAYGMGHSPWIWDDPDTYDPERWRKLAVDEQSKGEFASQPSTKNARGKFWAFGDGARDCLGQKMAMVEIQLVVAVLLAHFVLRLADRMGSWEEALPRQYLGLVLSIDGGMWLTCSPRSALEE